MERELLESTGSSTTFRRNLLLQLLGISEGFRAKSKYSLGIYID